MGLARTRETRRNRPEIEALEGRAVLSTMHAATVAQLQADIAAVNNTSGPNTILLAAGTYELTGALQVQNAGNLTIAGNPKNKDGVNLLGAPADRVFTIDGGRVTLANVTISGGSGVAQGGGIEAHGANLTIKNSVISNNAAQLSGGGIDVQGGMLTVENSTVTANAVGGQAFGFGGGIAAANAPVSITNSLITDNAVNATALGPQAVAGALGGGIFAQGGTLAVTGSTIGNNSAIATTDGVSATSLGGGVGSSGAVVTVTRGKVANNTVAVIASQTTTARGSAFATIGGSLTITGGTLSGNTPGGPAEFYHPGAKVILNRPVIDGKRFPVNVPLGGTGFLPGR